MRAGTLDFPIAVTAVAVSGRYAYAGTGGSDDRVHVIDVSNPSSPTRVGSIAFPADVQTITISGRYAYVGIASDPNALRIIDISTPSRPVQASYYSSATAIGGIAVSGRYAYIANGDTDEFSIVDLGGAEISSLLAHSLEAGSLQVQTTARVAQNLSVDGALNVGVGGIFSNGSVGISLPATTTKFSTQTSLLTLTHGTSTWEGTGIHMDFATTTSGFGSLPSFTGNFLKFDRASTTRFIVDSEGRMGISSTTAGSFLSVQGGNAQITGTTTSHALVATSTLFIGAQGNLFNVMQSGFAGVGTTSPGSLLSVSGSSGLGLVNTGAASTFYAYDEANDTSPFMIDATGNVGIGTASPGKKFEVSVAAADQIIRLTDTAVAHGFTTLVPTAMIGDFGDASALGGLLFRGFSQDGANNQALIFEGMSGSTGTLTIPPVDFRAWKRSGTDRTAVTGTDRAFQFLAGSDSANALVTILGGGNVGIGSTTPGTLLGINGAVSLLLSGTVTTNGVCHTGGNTDVADSTVGRQLVACSGAPADIAEWYATESEVEAGDIVAPSPTLVAYEAQGKILIFVNLGYAKLDSAATVQATNAAPTTNAWSVDQATGKVNVSFFGDINLQGNVILDVEKITGYLGKWSIDEDGTLMAVKVITEEIITKRLKAEDIETKSIHTQTGVSVNDKTTGEIYCMYVEQGAMRATPGACKESESVSPAGDPPPPLPPPQPTLDSSSSEPIEENSISSDTSDSPADASSDSANNPPPLLGSPAAQENEPESESETNENTSQPDSISSENQ